MSYGLVGQTAVYDDGATLPVERLDFLGNPLVTVQGGQYQEFTRRGQVFTATAAVAAIPKNDALTNAPALWNPADSGKVLIPVRIGLSPTAEGTVIIHGLTLSYLKNTGATVATGLPVATWTNIAPVCNLLGGSQSSNAKFAAATVTYTANPTRFLDLGMGLWTDGTPASSGPFSQLVYDFHGLLMLKPGTLIALGASAASSTTYGVSIEFIEIPDFTF